MVLMLPPNTVWKLKPPSPLASQLALEAGLTTLQAQLLINRGISNPSQAKSFLCPRLDCMADPMLLKDMDRALAVILKAVEVRKKITIYGDYDADGLTATALLLNFFKCLGIETSS
jgi:single-stranded-DNA-specific exonuclease